MGFSKAKYKRGLRYNLGALVDKILFYNRLMTPIMKYIYQKDHTFRKSNSFLNISISKDKQWLLKLDSPCWKVRRTLKKKSWMIREQKTILLLQEILGRSFPETRIIPKGYKVRLQKDMLTLDKISKKKKIKPAIYEGFSRIHEAGLIHGNITTHNILVDPKTLDFMIIDWDDMTYDQRLLDWEKAMLDSLF